MQMNLPIRIGSLSLVLALLSPSARAADERGRLLYENHCQACHTSTVHVREARKVRTASELRAYIARWSGELKLAWGPDEQEAVFRHLSSRYYRFLTKKP